MIPFEIKKRQNQLEKNIDVLNNNLINLKTVVVAKNKEIISKVEAIKVKNGKDGLMGRDGLPGRDGKDGVPGKDGVDGKDGLPGKDGVDGKTPVKGVDYNTKEDKEEILIKTLARIRQPKDGEKAVVDEAKIADTVVNIIKEKELLSTDNVKGLRNELTSYRSQLAMKQAGQHGGGDTVVAGSNITIVNNSNGTKTINSGGLSGLITDNQSAATANTAILQAALIQGGKVTISDPGTVYINATLVVYSNTNVHIEYNTTIKMADGFKGGIFTNYAARLTPETVGIGDASWVSAPDTQDFAITCVNMAPGANVRYPVDSYVSVIATGHGNSGAMGQAQNNRGYRGVWKVAASTNTSITYLTRRTYPGSNNNTVVLSIHPADTNISYTGGGTIDGNGALLSQVDYLYGDPKGNVIWTRNARDVSIDGLNFKRGITWTIGSNYVRDYVVKNITSDSRGGISLDTVHLVGQHQSVHIEGVTAKSSDNVVGLTIDITDDPTNPSFPTFNFEYQHPGEMFDITVNNIYGQSVGEATVLAICAVYGPAQYAYHNLTFDNIAGIGASAFQISNYPFTGMNNCNGDKIRVSNLHALCNGPQMNLTAGEHNWDEIILDDVVVTEPLAPVVQFDAGTTGTIKQFIANNIFFTLGDYVTLRTGATFIFGGLNINNVTISNCENNRMSSGVPLSQHSAGTIDRLNFRNVSASTTGGTAGALHAVTGAGVCTTAVFDNCFFNGASSQGSLFIQGSTAVYGTLILNNCRVENAEGFFTGANTTNSINIFMNNNVLGASCVRAGVFAGPTNLFVNGYHELSAPSSNPFRVLTSGKAYNFLFENVSRDTDSIDYVAGDFRFRGGGARTARANVTSPAIGDSLFSTTDNVVYGRNASSAWQGLY